MRIGGSITTPKDRIANWVTSVQRALLTAKKCHPKWTKSGRPVSLGGAAVVYLTFLSPWLVGKMTDPLFHEAHSLVGILAWQSLFYGFFLIGSVGIWKSEKTYIGSILIAIIGVINLLLNYIWVPIYGGMGAGLATVFSYFLWVFIAMLISESYWRVRFPFCLLLGQVAIGSLACAALIWGDLSMPVIVFITHTTVLLLVGSALELSNWKLFLSKIKDLRYS